jgi:integrase/recombinase XerD
MSISNDWNNQLSELIIARTSETKKLLSNPLLNKDTWDTIKDLKLKMNQHNKILTINFGAIKQDWLKLLSKLYILIRSQRNYSVNYLNQDVFHLTKFSHFLSSKSIFNLAQIDNNLFEEFDYYLRSIKSNETKKNLSERSILLNYTTLINFFNLCRHEEWIDVNTYWFKGKYKYSEVNDNEIDYLPEEVWNQLEENLYLLPEQIQRMVLIIRTTGLRIGELLNLPFDCLRQRGNKWYLRLKSEKYDIEDELPITAIELVTIIQEQQNYIKNLFGEKYCYLLCSNYRLKITTNKGWEFKNPNPRIMRTQTFNRWLNRLSQKANIRSKDGELWYFKSHQFRKTVATVMTNAGIRDLVIQKYLRHRSPDMQRHYKHLLKQVLGSEYEELTTSKKYVDITGNLVASYQPISPVTEIIRRRMYQITTQYGECHRPTLKKPCPTVNACWKCKEWRVSSDDLPYLKEDLQRVEDELQSAKVLGMIRQQQGLEDDINILINCIQGLENND